VAYDPKLGFGVNAPSSSATEFENPSSSTLPGRQMTSELTEEEMRRALFGDAQGSGSVTPSAPKEMVSELVVIPPAKAASKKKIANAFTPRLKVVMRVGNEFEGETFEMIHEADTLSTLLAEQEATKAARKKFRYVEVISVKPM
jgi:hypothetical protein